MTGVKTRRDPDFYFAFRTFKVEDAVFRVPRHLFLMPNAKIEPVPQGGDTGDDLVELGEEVKKDDFLQLLRAVYPRKYSNPEILTTSQWQTVLKLSENFGMEDVRQKAVRNLKDFFFDKDPIDALICARQNRLDEWTEPLIEKIVEMRRELTRDELEKVGTPTAIKIAWALGAAGTPMSLDSPGTPMSLDSPGTPMSFDFPGPPMSLDSPGTPMSFDFPVPSKKKKKAKKGELSSLPM